MKWSMDHVAHLVVGDWGSGIEQLCCLSAGCCSGLHVHAGDAQLYIFFKVPSMPCQFPEKFWTRNIYFWGVPKLFIDATLTVTNIYMNDVEVCVRLLTPIDRYVYPRCRNRLVQIHGQMRHLFPDTLKQEKTLPLTLPLSSDLYMRTLRTTLGRRQLEF
jgi:hypothetical protein